MIESKEEAMEVLNRTRKDFLLKARELAIKIVKEKGQVTTDDIRLQIEIPKGVDGRVMGAVFNSKTWISIGYKKSEIETSHRRPISIFKLR